MPILRAALFATILAAAACGSDEPPPPGLAVDLVADDNVFVPDTASALVGEVTFTLENQGAVPHKFNLLQPGVRISGANQFDPATSLGEILVGRDMTASTTIALSAGTYQYVCLIPGHLEAGMAGELTVG